MIEKGTLKVGDRLEGKHKGTAYHAVVEASGDGSLVFKAEDGPAKGKQFTSLSALARATGSVRNGWTFFSLAGQAPAGKGGRRAKPKDKVERWRCTFCGQFYKTAQAAASCHCTGAKEARAAKEAGGDVPPTFESVMVSLIPAADEPKAKAPAARRAAMPARTTGKRQAKAPAKTRARPALAGQAA